MIHETLVVGEQRRVLLILPSCRLCFWRAFFQAGAKNCEKSLSSPLFAISISQLRLPLYNLRCCFDFKQKWRLYIFFFANVSNVSFTKSSTLVVLLYRASSYPFYFSYDGIKKGHFSGPRSSANMAFSHRNIQKNGCVWDVVSTIKKRPPQPRSLEP